DIWGILQPVSLPAPSATKSTGLPTGAECAMPGNRQQEQMNDARGATQSNKQKGRLTLKFEVGRLRRTLPRNELVHFMLAIIEIANLNGVTHVVASGRGRSQTRLTRPRTRPDSTLTRFSRFHTECCLPAVLLGALKLVNRFARMQSAKTLVG